MVRTSRGPVEPEANAQKNNQDIIEVFAVMEDTHEEGLVMWLSAAMNMGLMVGVAG